MFTRLHPHVANWDQTGEALIQRVHREAVGSIPDPDTGRLLDDVLSLAAVPQAWRKPDFVATPLPMLPVEFAKDGMALSYFSLVTTVGTPQDVTLQEIRHRVVLPSRRSHRAPPLG